MTAKTSSTKTQAAKIEKLEKELAGFEAVLKERRIQNYELQEEITSLKAEKMDADRRARQAEALLNDEKFRADEAEQMLEKANGYIAALIEGTERKGPFHFTPACHSCGRS